MDSRKPFMWLFIFILLVFAAGLVHIAHINKANGDFSEPFYRPVSHDTTFQHYPSERLDFTGILEEQSNPTADSYRPVSSGKSVRKNNPAQSDKLPSVSYQAQQYKPQPISLSAPVSSGSSYQTSRPQNNTHYISGQNTYSGNNVSGRISSGANGTEIDYPAKGQTYQNIRANSQRLSSQETNGGDLLDAYMPRQTLEERQEMDRKVNQFSDALDRAIAKALQPKSKREQNIEKYMPHKEGESTSAVSSPAETVRQQIAAQAKTIVRDMRKNYGAEIAGQAADIMNEFQKEMADLLNSSLDPMEKQIAAQRLNNKYNGKLQALNKKASNDKLRDQLSAENEQYLKKVTQVYGTDVANALRPVMENYANKRAVLYMTPMTEEDMIKQETALQEELRKEQEAVLTKYAPGATGTLTGLKNEEIEKRVQAEAEAVRTGRLVSPVYEGNSGTIRKEWNERRDTILSNLKKQSASPELQEYAATRYNQLTNDLVKLNEKATEENWTVAKWNEESVKLQKAAQDDYLNYASASVEKKYNDWYEDQYKNLEDSKKEQARAIWEKYNHQRVELERIPLSEQESKRRRQEIDQQERNQLQSLIEQQ